MQNKKCYLHFHTNIHVKKHHFQNFQIYLHELCNSRVYSERAIFVSVWYS